MVENSKTKLDIRILQERDPELFKLLVNSGKPIKELRKIFEEWGSLKQENQKLKEEANSFKNDLTGIKLSARQAQKNTEILLGITNAWLFTQQVPQPFSRDEKQHPYLAYYDTEYRNMLDRIAQKKIYKDNQKETSKKSREQQILEEGRLGDNPF